MGIELTNDQVTAIYKGETWFRSQTKQVFEISGPGGSGTGACGPVSSRVLWRPAPAHRYRPRHRAAA